MIKIGDIVSSIIDESHGIVIETKQNKARVKFFNDSSISGFIGEDDLEVVSTTDTDSAICYDNA
jgi:hypothetical protein